MCEWAKDGQYVVHFMNLIGWIFFKILQAAVCYEDRCLIQEKQLVIPSEMYAKS